MKEFLETMVNPLDMNKIKTFNYFICHYLMRMMERDPDGYIKKQVLEEIGENWQSPELIKLSSECDGFYMRFKFYDGKIYDMKIGEFKETAGNL